MSRIDQKLIQESQAIFDQLDKWNALFEIYGLTENIIEHWFVLGTKGLRNYFAQNPFDSWRWEPWENERDTRWYLEEFGCNSLAIGFGWRYQFHLHLIDDGRFNSSWIDEQLRTEKYAKLLMPFGVNPSFGCQRGSKAMEKYLDFSFGSINDGNVPSRELAWYAAHRTNDFIKQAANKIKQFTSDPEMTRLLAELNAEAKTKSS